MRPSDFISLFILLAATTSAWPTGWPSWESLQPAKREVAPLLAARAPQATTKFDLSYTGKQGNTATTAQQAQSSSTIATITGGNGGKTTPKPTNSNNNGGSNNGKNATATKNTYETTKTFDQRLPAGGVEMITPSAIAGPQYYKVGDYVTWAWNYTSLSITPSAIDILASCSLNQATYTIAVNQSVADATQAITWDTGAYQSSATTKLLVATYTLIIYDAQSAITDVPRAGYLAPYEQFTFGMYTPQPYVAQKPFKCATCNDAPSAMGRQTLGVVLGVVGVTVMSFGWFAGVAGLW